MLDEREHMGGHRSLLQTTYATVDAFEGGHALKLLSETLRPDESLAIKVGAFKSNAMSMGH